MYFFDSSFVYVFFTLFFLSCIGSKEQTFRARNSENSEAFYDILVKISSQSSLEFPLRKKSILGWFLRSLGPLGELRLVIGDLKEGLEYPGGEWEIPTSNQW